MSDHDTRLLIEAVKAWNEPIGTELQRKIESLESQLYYTRRDQREDEKKTNP